MGMPRMRIGAVGRQANAIHPMKMGLMIMPMRQRKQPSSKEVGTQREHGNETTGIHNFGY
ncbi:hypothetical protein FF011L_15300 [Roseimaritima multifibrata]|uniref:Uncharacterized protein n=1 Tax=Roseimaritima multifibrata TaxID=1930274 RepID=A0A517MD24_9BACT|nr:hypothetical protein FF011L_15300 [Roseimaritima multifibrata]